MRYIHDAVKTRELFDKLISKGVVNWRYSYVESVKMRNTLTRNQTVVKDLIFFATGDNSNKVRLLIGIQDLKKDTFTFAHHDVNHPNMQSSWEAYTTDDMKYRIYFRGFCNPVLQCHVWNNPVSMSKILKGNLMDHNPNDRWRTPASVSMVTNSQVYRYRDTNGRVNSKATLAQMVTLRQSGKPTNQTELKDLAFIYDKLNKDHDLVYACCRYCVKREDGYVIINPVLEWVLVNKKDLLDDNMVVSDYYRIYSYEDIEEKIEIEREDIDMVMVGCGSAGSNIASQLARTTYLSSLLLIDPDKVENKNLRNQAYKQGDVNNYKVSALYNYIRQLNVVNNTVITSNCSKFEDVFWECYKIKYLVVGLDKLETRKDLLDRVERGEIVAKYLIDTRYLGLTSSLYLIDLEDENQFKYYKTMLEEDIKEYDEYHKRLLEENNISTEYTQEEVDRYCEMNGIYSSACAQYRGIFDVRSFGCPLNHEGGCRSPQCKAFWKKTLEENNALGEVSSCVKENYIHIYTLTSSWVTSAIRSIETDSSKHFTHVELGCEPIPNAIIVRK